MKSFVNADSFESPKALADYLLHLSRNHSEFLGYFEWKVNLAEDFANTIRRAKNGSLKYVDYNPRPFCVTSARSFTIKRT
jgi:hypothetical protein